MADTEASSPDEKPKKKKQKKTKHAIQYTESQPLDTLVGPEEVELTSTPSKAKPKQPKANEVAIGSKKKKTKKAKNSIQPSEVESAEISEKLVTIEQEDLPKETSNKRAIKGEDPINISDVTARKTNKRKKAKQSNVQPELAHTSEPDDKAESIKVQSSLRQETTNDRQSSGHHLKQAQTNELFTVHETYIFWLLQRYQPDDNL